MNVSTGSWHCAQAPDALLDWLHGSMMGAKGVMGASRPTVDSLEVRSQAIPAWAVIVAILLFPIGLLALMAKDQMALLVRVVPAAEGGSTLFLSGSASQGLSKYMATVYQQTAVLA
jgi:hypothetical protein